MCTCVIHQIRANLGVLEEERKKALAQGNEGRAEEILRRTAPIARNLEELEGQRESLLYS